MKNLFHIMKLALIPLAIYGFYLLVTKNGYHQEHGKMRVSNIYSLKTSSNNTEGSFFLGVGSIRGVDYYTFYRETKGGALIREKIKASNCMLHEGHPKPLMSEAGLIQHHLVWGDTIAKHQQFHRKHGSYISLYIPEGTVTKRVSLDFK